MANILGLILHIHTCQSQLEWNSEIQLSQGAATADAARTIAGLPLTEANYYHVIAILQDRYGQQHKIVDAHMQALLEMPSPLNNLASLCTFYDIVEGHIRGLSSLSKSQLSYGDLLIPIIMGKLPTDLQRNLAQEHSNSPWNLPDLWQLFSRKFRSLSLHHMTHTGVCQGQQQLHSMWPPLVTIPGNKITLTTIRNRNVCSVRRLIQPTTVMW